MVFIRKRLVEDDFTDGSAAELVDAGIEQIASQDSSAEEVPTTEDVAEETPQERFYDWHDIIEVLSDYMHPDIIRQIEDDWMFNYPDNFMDQASVDDLINDINSQYNEELASEIKGRIDQLQDPKATAALDLSTDIGILQDTLDKISDVNIKEKLINLIDSLK